MEESRITAYSHYIDHKRDTLFANGGDSLLPHRAHIQLNNLVHLTINHLFNMTSYLSRLNPDYGVGFHSLSRIDSLLNSVFDNALYSNSRHLNLDETDEGYDLTLELPGFKSPDVEVTLENGILTIAAKRGEHSYRQCVTLPRGVDADKIEARLEDGLLSLTLPKAATAKARKIALK